jgi:hypothetical protein
MLARYVVKIDTAYGRAREEQARLAAEREGAGRSATAVLAAAISCHGAIHRAARANGTEMEALARDMDEAMRELERQGRRNPADAEPIRALVALASAFLTHYRASVVQRQRAATLPPYAQGGATQATDDMMAALDRTFESLDQAVTAYRTRGGAARAA